MSSIRLFVLDALARHGEMHGHQLRHLAEQERVALWTDITVGALYGALKRLAADGLIAAVRTEQIGGYPERQVWDITRDGRGVLAALREDALRGIVLRPDPVDLGLARQDPERLDEVPGLIASRLAGLRSMLAEAEGHERTAAPYLTPLEARVLGHKHARIAAEIAWHERLLADLPELLAEETARREHPHD